MVRVPSSRRSDGAPASTTDCSVDHFALWVEPSLLLLATTSARRWGALGRVDCACRPSAPTRLEAASATVDPLPPPPAYPCSPARLDRGGRPAWMRCRPATGIRRRATEAGWTRIVSLDRSMPGEAKRRSADDSAATLSRRVSSWRQNSRTADSSGFGFSLKRRWMLSSDLRNRSVVDVDGSAMDLVVVVGHDGSTSMNSSNLFVIDEMSDTVVCESSVMPSQTVPGDVFGSRTWSAASSVASHLTKSSIGIGSVTSSCGRRDRNQSIGTLRSPVATTYRRRRMCGSLIGIVFLDLILNFFATVSWCRQGPPVLPRSHEHTSNAVFTVYVTVGERSLGTCRTILGD